MSTWSDLGLPALQAPGYGYAVEASLIRTPFGTEHPNQARVNRLNRKEFTAEVLLTQHELNIAEAFIEEHGYDWFTVGVLTGRPSGTAYVDLNVRLMDSYQVSTVGYNTYRLAIKLES